MASHDVPVAYEWLVRIAIGIAGSVSAGFGAWFVFRGKKAEVAVSHEQQMRTIAMAERAATVNDLREIIKHLQEGYATSEARLDKCEAEQDRLREERNAIRHELTNARTIISLHEKVVADQGVRIAQLEKRLSDADALKES